MFRVEFLLKKKNFWRAVGFQFFPAKSTGQRRVTRSQTRFLTNAATRPLLLSLHEVVVFEYLRANHDACNCYRLISQVSSQVRLWPWIYHKNLNCRYWNEIMCATVVTFKTKHTVGGRKISLGRPDMHMPVIEVNLHNVTSYQKQRLFSFNCKCLQKLIMWLI